MESVGVKKRLWVIEVEFRVWGYKKCGSGSDCLKKVYVLGVVMI